MAFGLQNITFTLLMGICLCGCVQENRIEGSRVNITDEMGMSDYTRQIRLPKQVNKTSWGGLSSTVLKESENYRLRKNVELAWQVKTGLTQIINSPVIFNKKLLALGANGQVTCIDLTNKKVVWNSSVHSINEIKKPIIGGGVSFDNSGNLFISTSLGDILSISIETGDLNWRYRAAAPILDAPTVVENGIIITDASGVTRAFSSTGKLRWILEGIGGRHLRAETGRPIVFGELLLLPNSGGVLNAVNKTDGLKVWSFNFVDKRLGYAQNAFGAFYGTPRVFAENVYYGNVNGQFNALNKLGESVWQTEVGLQGSPLLIADSLFFISDRNELVRLNKNNGKIIWSRVIKSNGSLKHYFTPILAGSKLWLTGTDKYLRSFDVASGTSLDKISIESAPTGPAIYYSGSIIVYTKSGELISFK